MEWTQSTEKMNVDQMHLEGAEVQEFPVYNPRGTIQKISVIR